MVANTVEYVLEGNNIVQVNSRRTLVMPKQDFLQSLRNLTMPSTPEFLPRNCRLHFNANGYTYFVVELTPGVYPIYWDGSSRITETWNEQLQTIQRRTVNSKGGNMEVAFPWQYFVFQFQKNKTAGAGQPVDTFVNLYLYWSPERLTSLTNTLLYGARIPNIDEYGIVCLGDLHQELTSPAWEKIEETVSSFYSPDCKFNRDLGWTWPYNNSPTRWQKESVADPNCWTRWELPRTSKTLAQWLTIETNPVHQVALDYILSGAMSGGQPQW